MLRVGRFAQPTRQHCACWRFALAMRPGMANDRLWNPEERAVTRGVVDVNGVA